MIQATFFSSDGERVYTVSCVGDPIRSVTCTCKGYENLKQCKHLDAVLAGSGFAAVPATKGGYDDACAAMQSSPARAAYFQLLDNLLELDKQRKALNDQEKAIKKAFYRKLAEGII